MLKSLRALEGYSLQASDGSIGAVADFYFEDEHWIIRYLVVDTGRWLPGRKVLIPPAVAGIPDWRTEKIPVDLSKRQVRESPDIDLEKTVSRRQESALYDYYGWPVYWPSDALFTPSVPMASGIAVSQGAAQGREVQAGDESRLRSVKEVSGYTIQATDGEIGGVRDFIVEEGGWRIRYIVISTGNWLPGKSVLVPPDWIEEVNWAKSSVAVNVDRESVRRAPAYDPAAPVNREYEVRLYDYYGRPKYWP